MCAYAHVYGVHVCVRTLKVHSSTTSIITCSLGRMTITIIITNIIIINISPNTSQISFHAPAHAHVDR
jgi:hypothetical protein